MLTRSCLLRLEEAWLFWEYFPNKGISRRVFDGEMFIKTQRTFLLQILYQRIYYDLVMFINVMDPDDTCEGELRARMDYSRTVIRHSAHGAAPANDDDVIEVHERVRYNRADRAIQIITCQHRHIFISSRSLHAVTPNLHLMYRFMKCHC